MNQTPNIRRITIAASATTLLLLAGCGDPSSTTSTTSTPTSANPVATTNPIASTTTGGATTVLVETTTTSTIAVATTVPPPAIPIAFDVADVAVPAGVVEPYLERDGTLLDTATAFERYSIPTLPYPDSPAAFVTEVQTAVHQRPNGGYSRYDSATWVFVDPRMASDIITSAQISAGIAERPWESLSLEAYELGDGAKCVQSERTNHRSTWTMIDCVRDSTHTFQAIRDGHADTATTPPIASSIVTANETIAAAIGGTVAGWELNLFSPTTTPVSRSKVIYQTSLDQTALADALRAALPGYGETAEDGYSNHSFDANGVSWKVSNISESDGTTGQASFVTPGDYADWT